MPIYANVNVFETNTAGVLARTTNTLSYSGEPTGITLDPATGTYYITDDDRDQVWVITRGPDGQLNTADDTRRPFRVNNFCFDAESIAWDNARHGSPGSAAGVLHRLRAGTTGIFDGGTLRNDVVTSSTSSIRHPDLTSCAVRAARRRHACSASRRRGSSPRKGRAARAGYQPADHRG